MTAMIEFDKVSIVFGTDPGKALPLMDSGQTRPEIQKSTGQILGVHDCTLTVNQGEISVLMGLSGSGKSTLLRAVNGLNPVTRGRMLVRSRAGDMVDVVTCGPDDLRGLRRGAVSMVFQQFALLPVAERGRERRAGARARRRAEGQAAGQGARGAVDGQPAGLGREEGLGALGRACSSGSGWRGPSRRTRRSC